jgi:uncharacterized protein YecA (UPF0149 family)
MSETLVDLLRRALDETAEPLALVASWTSGRTRGADAVSSSSVDARKIASWDRVPEFLIGAAVVAADLVAELPADEPTLLQRRLDEGGTKRPSDSVILMPAARADGVRIGPNALCPCGSGKKHKRCCGR